MAFWLGLAAVTALVAFIVVLPLMRAVHPSAPAWGWAKPGGLAQQGTSRDYLLRLAAEADEWFRVPPKDASALKRRLEESRQGCAALLAAENQPLSTEDRTWLKNQCRAWDAHYALALAELQAGDSVDQVLAEADRTGNQIFQKLRGKAGEPATDQRPLLSDSGKSQEKKKSPQSDEPFRVPDVIYVATPYSVVEKMFEMVDLKKGDVLYDLGCGDGRIPVMAAKYFGVRAFGFDIDANRVQESILNARRNNVEDLVTIKKQDIFELDLTPASVIAMYILPEMIVRLEPQLVKLKPGTRIVSHDAGMKGAKPKQMVRFRAKPDEGLGDREHTLYMWVVPWEKE